MVSTGFSDVFSNTYAGRIPTYDSRAYEKSYPSGAGGEKERREAEHIISSLSLCNQDKALTTALQTR
jgi:hypothetical protein